jgi:hypothetical protein
MESLKDYLGSVNDGLYVFKRMSPCCYDCDGVYHFYDSNREVIGKLFSNYLEENILGKYLANKFYYNRH